MWNICVADSCKGWKGAFVEKEHAGSCWPPQEGNWRDTGFPIQKLLHANAPSGGTLLEYSRVVFSPLSSLSLIQWHLFLRYLFAHICVFQNDFGGQGKWLKQMAQVMRYTESWWESTVKLMKTPSSPKRKSEVLHSK